MEHDENPATHALHMEILNNLVPEVQATHVAIQNGQWNDSNTWGDSVPSVNSKVLIPLDIDVALSGSATANWILINGCLHIENNTSLVVDTIVVSKVGCLEVGLENEPGENILVTFSDTGPLNPIDWTELSRGLLVIGECTIWGQPKTSYTHTEVAPRVGNQTLTLESTPINWSIGDVLVVPGARKPKTLFFGSELTIDDVEPVFREQNEIRTITNINGNVVTLNLPLSYDFHYQLAPNMKLAIGNLTRTVTFKSESKTTNRRGHIMFMPAHPMNYKIGYCAINDCGRTTSKIHVTDPQKDINGIVIPTTVANIRGRYSLHFHKMGYESRADVEGVSFRGGLKWNLSVHGESKVDVTKSVSFDCEGAHFNTENGLEIGSFTNCLSIYAKGFGKNNANGVRGDIAPGRDQFMPEAIRLLIAPVGFDQGFAGYGYWLHGPLFTVSDCEAYSSMSEGIAFIQDSLEKDANGKFLEIPVSQLTAEMKLALGVSTSSLHPARIPFHGVNNTVVGAKRGIGMYAALPSILESDIKGGYVVNCLGGVFVYPVLNFSAIDSVYIYNHPNLIPNQAVPNNTIVGVETYQDLHGLRIHNCRIENCLRGILMSQNQCDVTGNQTLLRNVENIRFGPTPHKNITYRIQLPESSFEQPDQTTLMAMLPTTFANVQLWNINVPATHPVTISAKPIRLWERPGKAVIQIFHPDEILPTGTTTFPKINGVVFVGEEPEPEPEPLTCEEEKVVLQTQLDGVTAQLVIVNAQLTTVNAQLVTTGAQLVTANSALSTANAQLVASNTELATVNANLANLLNQLITVNAQLATANTQIVQLQTDKTNLENQVTGLQNQTNVLQDKLNRLDVIIHE